MFSRTHLRRLAGTTVAFVLLTGLLTGTAIAKPPNYFGEAPETPDVVSHGGQVMFAVSWRNDSGANLPTVNMTAATPTGAEFVGLLAGSPSQGTCSSTASLLTCAFGTVNAGASVWFDAVYRVPTSGSSFTVDFVFTAQGSTQNDNPKKSRGDDMPVTGTVELVAVGSDRAGSFISGDITSVESNPNLSKQRNPQAAKLDFSTSGEENFGATISEAASSRCAEGITTCYGNETILIVKNGQVVNNGFLVTLGYFQVPGTAQGGFVHWTSDTAYELIEPGDTCLATGGEMPCIHEIKKTNGNTFFLLLMDQNGPMRGY